MEATVVLPEQTDFPVPALAAVAVAVVMEKMSSQMEEKVLMGK